jgi:hypothetical protein
MSASDPPRIAREVARPDDRLRDVALRTAMPDGKYDHRWENLREMTSEREAGIWLAQ